MKSLPPSTHAVARIVRKNPNWALESAVMYDASREAQASTSGRRDLSAHAAVQAAARAFRERKETD